MSNISDIIYPKIISKKFLLQNYFAENFKKNPAILYSSVDLRHSGFKIAPIDVNCFPAGFNNVKGKSQEKAKKISSGFFKDHFPDSKKILIIAENHTRNLNYLQNLLSLQKIIQNDQNQVIIGTLLPEIESQITLELENSEKITLQKIVKDGDLIKTKLGFTPDLAILNNDLTAGIYPELKNVKTPIVPSTKLGWFQRSKATHFDLYNKVAKEVAEILEIDPWLISSMHEVCQEVNFKQNIGFQCLAKEVDYIISNLKEKYNQHHIKEDPFCYIKADNGTYGMAVMQVYSADEALNLNKKERNKMNMLKERKQNTIALIQEGITTCDTIHSKTCEPLIYIINGQVVANLVRANEGRDNKKSLNAKGAVFYDINNLQDDNLNIGSKKEKMMQIYSLIAQISSVAVSHELNI